MGYKNKQTIIRFILQVGSFLLSIIDLGYMNTAELKIGQFSYMYDGI